MAIDRFGRNIHYLRISLTDHCNLRCVYCMPEDMTFHPNAELMQDDEIMYLMRLFTNLGFDKFRLTGGEPTVRDHIVDLVRQIASTPGVRHLTMTTNGVLLSKLANPLADAGLQRVNISLDTLDADKFHRLTRWGSLEDVWGGIQAAERAGLTPVKINAVVVRGYNECDVADLARLTIENPWQVRFIEMMPFAGATQVQLQQVVTAQEIQERIEAELGRQQRRAGWRDAPLPLAGRQRRGGLHLIRHRTFLRGLHPRPPDRRWSPALMSFTGGRGRPAHSFASRRHIG